MADSYDAILNLILMTYGSDSDQWGAPNTNNNNTWIAQAVAGINTVTISGVNYTLSNTQGAANEARRRVQVVTTTSAQTGNVQVIIPSSQQGWWLFDNQAVSGGFAVTVGINGGNTVSLPYSRRTIVRTDGTTTVAMEPTLDKITAPVAAVDLASQKITSLATPTAGTDAATKAYVDANTNTSINNLPAPTGNLSMATWRIINMGAPLNANDATTMQYVQGAIAGAIAAATLSGTITSPANLFFAGPVTGSPTTPTFRLITQTDLDAANIQTFDPVANQVFS